MHGQLQGDPDRGCERRAREWVSGSAGHPSLSRRPCDLVYFINSNKSLPATAWGYSDEQATPVPYPRFPHV